VWVEVLVGTRWVHLDPCEAAVDEPWLYQSWGKNQTYVVAFTREEVIDVTEQYTSDFSAALSRREISQSEFDRHLARATNELRKRNGTKQLTAHINTHTHTHACVNPADLTEPSEPMTTHKAQIA
jgi:hypothetical protein